MCDLMRTSSLLILLVCFGKGALGQAPESISGDTYLDIVSNPGPFISNSRMKFFSNGTYTTQIMTISGTPAGVGSYLTPINGSYVYSKESPSVASIILTPSTGVPETLALSFSNYIAGSVTRGGVDARRNGTFNLAQPASDKNASLVNLSTLVNVSQGNSVVVGFVVGGSRIREFLVRAVGPSLSSFAIASPAPNPVYSIATSSGPVAPMPGAINSGVLFSLGHGWSSFQSGANTISDEEALVGAFPLPAGSNDKADIYLLYPGAYSIIVTPPNSQAEGAELVEVYEVP